MRSVFSAKSVASITGTTIANFDRTGSLISLICSLRRNRIRLARSADWFGNGEHPRSGASAAGFRGSGRHGDLLDVHHRAKAYLVDLRRASREGKEGYVSGVIAEINSTIAKHLNLRRWWTQDQDFELRVELRDSDLAFKVSDRTDSHYSFGERSTGLKYFLSYLIQFLAHEPASDGRDEILTMDEPDAYLSSQGQQDLLRVLGEFARPTVVERRPAQVVYVTHSPFLLDRNNAGRIRVLDKGAGEEGTRVVRDAARNHYEPLRSAFGSFVAETTFIGSGNLMVEGQADQVLLAGMSAQIRALRMPIGESLDLNRTTLVPCGGAESVPYLVYLARGRDVDRPAVVVLLDSDEEGDKAKKRLGKKPIGRGRLLDAKYIVQVGDIVEEADVATGVTVREIEDLLPVALAATAARTHAQRFLGLSATAAERLNASDVESRLADGIWKAVKAAFAATYGGDAHIDKVGFARAVIECVQNGGPGSDVFAGNMRVLLGVLNKRMRDAERDSLSERLARRIDRAKAAFLADNPRTASREDVRFLLEDIRGSLDDSNESADIRAELQKIRREFSLDDDVTRVVDDYDGLRSRIDAVRYVGRLKGMDIDEADGIEDPLVGLQGSLTDADNDPATADLDRGVVADESSSSA